ncbi:MAG: hypothetical protein L0J68_00860 [Micrococcaceae bacterium]|nr:hypothetical protein [Micrococcaceae bacterium]
MSSTQPNESWIEEFILALRLREVRGDAIGDATAVVRGHIADSGQDAHEAFGDPSFYAKQLDLPRQPNLRPGSPVIMGPAISLTGLLVFAQSIPAVFAGSPMEVSLPQLLLFALPCALVLALPYYFNLGVRHLWVFAVAFFVVIGAGIGAGLFDPDRGFPAWLNLQPLWFAIGSGAAMLAASVWSVVDDLRPPQDPLRGPPGPAPAPTGIVARLIGTIPHFLMPLIALAFLVSELRMP